MNQSNPLIHWQKPMIKVLLATAPLVVSGIYFFGWYVMSMLVVANIAGFITEAIFCRQWKQSVSSAVFVTSTLFVLSLPPTLPLWMVLAGTVFGVVFGKMAFGGFGRNVFNPALTGRAFLYVCFGAHMTSMWALPIPGLMGGLVSYSNDAVTSATPGMLLKTGEMFSLGDLFWGKAAGTIGGTSAVLALIGGIYLITSKTANYRIPISAIIGFLCVQTFSWLQGAPKAADPIHAILAGSFLVGAFYYATDPVSANQTNLGRWIYGFLIGILSSLIGTYSAWPAGTMFAILLANMFAPIMDYMIRHWQTRGSA